VKACESCASVRAGGVLECGQGWGCADGAEAADTAAGELKSSYRGGFGGRNRCDVLGNSQLSV
jgi:hypothetical protein